MLTSTSNLYETYDCLGVVVAEAYTGDIGKRIEILKAMKDITNALATQAAQLGGDAVICIQFGQQLITLRGAFGEDYKYHVWGSGTAIRRHVSA